MITATNQDLEKMVREKTFREDLYYRINVIPIRMPALREKPEDIPALAEHFLEKYKATHGEDPSRHLRGGHGAPRGVSLAGQRARARERHRAGGRTRAGRRHSSRQPAARSFGAERADAASSDVVLRDSGIDLERHLEELRRRYMAEAMERAHGVQTRAAEILGMTFRSFRYFAKKYGLTRGEAPPGRESCRRSRAAISTSPRSKAADDAEAGTVRR